MIYFVAILGLLLRLSYLNKPEGLWNDEYVSWFVANTPFNQGFWSQVIKQCHMPLYYLILKPFTGYSDLILRLTSVAAGVLSIFAMYYLGKEFSKKTGFFLATITSVLSFLIYYSQEVRFYSMLFLFSALTVLYTIRLIKNTNKKNIIMFTLSICLTLLTHVLGWIFITLCIIYVVYKKKSLPKTTIIISLIAFCLIIPLGLNILKMIPSSQWWGHFSYTNILFLFSDFFSPILTNNVNAPPVFFYNKNLIAWLLLPCLIVIYPLIEGFKQIKGLGIIAFSTIIVMSILACTGTIVFITKYSIEILPIFLLALALGFEKLGKVGNILFAIFITIHLTAFFTPNYVTKMIRKEGQRIPAEIIIARNPDNIIFTYYEPNRFTRYIDLSNKKVFYISKINRFEYLDNPQEILENIQSGDRVSIVFLDSVSFFDKAFIKANANNPKIPEMFLTFSRIKNCLIDTLNNDYKDFQVDKLGSWTVITATKK